MRRHTHRALLLPANRSGDAMSKMKPHFCRLFEVSSQQWLFALMYGCIHRNKSWKVQALLIAQTNVHFKRSLRFVAISFASQCSMVMTLRSKAFVSFRNRNQHSYSRPIATQYSTLDYKHSVYWPSSCLIHHAQRPVRRPLCLFLTSYKINFTALLLLSGHVPHIVFNERTNRSWIMTMMIGVSRLQCCITIWGDEIFAYNKSCSRVTWSPGHFPVSHSDTHISCNLSRVAPPPILNNSAGTSSGPGGPGNPWYC